MLENYQKCSKVFLPGQTWRWLRGIKLNALDATDKALTENKTKGINKFVTYSF